MRVHHRLDVWRRSIELAEKVYRAVGSFPKNEEYGLASQLKRAAVSIPSNIAEGAARKGRREFVRFPYIAAGSASEMDTQLVLASRLGYLSAGVKAGLDGELEIISRMISSLINSQKDLTGSRQRAVNDTAS